MPLENATTISQLDSTWPLGLDSASRGDDHLRLLKAVLKTQFPGSGGQGFSKPITVSEDVLNGLPDKVDGLVDKWFPVGTVVLRMDSVNPTNIYGGTWVLITGDASLTFGNGAVQSGTVVGNNNVVVPVPLHNHGVSHNLSVGRAGQHTHSMKTGSDRMSIDDVRGQWFRKGDALNYTEPAGEHDHPIYGGVSVQAAGTQGASINVSGARIAINVWRRTA